MTKYGSAFSGTDTLKRAPGESHNAASRHHKNVIDLAVDGGTAEAIKIAEIGPGNVIDRFEIDTDANVSALTFQIGTADDPDKYGAAVAGPNATVQTRRPPLALGVTPTVTKEEIFLTPSGAVPGAGTIRTNVVTSHR